MKTNKRLQQLPQTFSQRPLFLTPPNSEPSLKKIKTIFKVKIVFPIDLNYVNRHIGIL